MNKLWLIIKREYLTRVKRRSFILATLLTPFAFAIFTVVVGFIFSYKSDERRQVAVIDEAGILEVMNIKSDERINFTVLETNLEKLKQDFDKTDYDAILHLPALSSLMDKEFTVYFYSDKQPTPDIDIFMRERIRSSLKEYKIEKLALDKQQLKALDTRVSLEPEPITDAGTNATKMTSAVAVGIGSVMGFVMYMTVFIYGMMVMRSVMEEKTSRIVEVMISSVKPFQLMLGKIIGVGGVGLTQVAIWAILIPSISFLVNLVFGFDANPQMNMDTAEFSAEDMETNIMLAIQEIKNQNWWLLFPLFIFFFLGGYFLYASMFAAVGSAMGDDLGEGQSLTIPITIPVILAFYIMFAAVQAPHSSLARWSSIFPLFSPIVMPARLAFDPPLWEIILSMAVLLITAVFFVWLSGRIYRVGILMYGKKVTFKELAKWMIRSN